MLNILIADDHAIVRYGVSLLIKDIYPNSIIYECDNFDEAIKMLGNLQMNLVILDINIPGGNNLRMIDVIRLKQPAIKVLMFTAYDEHIFASRYLQAGADGYLVKDSPEEEISKAIRAVLNNELYVSDSIKQDFLYRLAGRKNSEGNVLQQLSNRETEVMQLLIKGNSTADICKLLNLQASTVSTYKTRIFEKLGIKNIVELIEKYNVLT